MRPVSCGWNSLHQSHALIQTSQHITNPDNHLDQHCQNKQRAEATKVVNTRVLTLFNFRLCLFILPQTSCLNKMRQGLAGSGQTHCCDHIGGKMSYLLCGLRNDISFSSRVIVMHSRNNNLASFVYDDHRIQYV